ncbi:MAG: hypothetical protein ACREQ4_15420 [Candidatus Binataceae bacterium]
MRIAGKACGSHTLPHGNGRLADGTPLSGTGEKPEEWFKPGSGWQMFKVKAGPL